jgi:hypothetical protein
MESGRNEVIKMNDLIIAIAIVLVVNIWITLENDHEISVLKNKLDELLQNSVNADKKQ